MCWTGKQPTGAGLENTAGCEPTAAHCFAVQSSCQEHMGAAGVPEPSCPSPAKPWGSWWTGWIGQLGSTSDTMPTAGVCLILSCPSKPPFPPQFRLLNLLLGPLIVPGSPGISRLCSGLGLRCTPCPRQPVSAQASLTPAWPLAPAWFLRILDLNSPYASQGDSMALLA